MRNLIMLIAFLFTVASCSEDPWIIEEEMDPMAFNDWDANDQLARVTGSSGGFLLGNDWDVEFHMERLGLNAGSHANAPLWCEDHPEYDGPTGDIQKDAFCQYVYLIWCHTDLGGTGANLDEIETNCETYVALSGTNDCPYCPPNDNNL
ncbi:hypothetical protein ACFLT1_08440 [Bacteroidota bacterium]